MRVTRQGFVLVLGLQFGAAQLACAQEAAPAELPPARLDMGLAEATEQLPLRVTLSHEIGYKVEDPERWIKNRSSLQLEYTQYLHDAFSLRFNGKATNFWNRDHRHAEEKHDTWVSQAYVQTSFGQTSIRAGIQTMPWGESILAPVTDEVSPRDNQELFNINLEELRIGQGMLVVDQFSALGQWSVFYIPRPKFNKSPRRGSAYDFDPFAYRPGIEGEKGGEYGASWKKNFESADFTLMGASLLENELAVRVNEAGLAVRSQERFSMAGAVLNVALRDFVLRGELAWKQDRPFNTQAMGIVKKNTLDAYIGIDYRYSPTLTFSLEAVNQHISGWQEDIAGAPRDRQSLLLSFTKLLLNEDLSINVINFSNRPYTSNLSMLMASWKWNDQLTFGLNAMYPHVKDKRAGLWNVRDQKQLALKVQYQF